MTESNRIVVIILISANFRLRVLLDNRDNENSCLAHTTLSLTNNISADDCLRNNSVLNFGRMLKAAIRNGAEKKWVQHEILPSHAAHSHMSIPVQTHTHKKKKGEKHTHNTEREKAQTSVLQKRLLAEHLQPDPRNQEAQSYPQHYP